MQRGETCCDLPLVIQGEPYEGAVVGAHDVVVADFGHERLLAVAVRPLAVEVIGRVDGDQALVLAGSLMTALCDVEILVRVSPGIEPPRLSDVGQAVRVGAELSAECVELSFQLADLADRLENDRLVLVAAVAGNGDRRQDPEDQEDERELEQREAGNTAAAEGTSGRGSAVAYLPVDSRFTVPCGQPEHRGASPSVTSARGGLIWN